MVKKITTKLKYEIMKKYKWILFFLLVGFFACNDDNTLFTASTEGLELKFTPVAGGAIMHYTLPNDRNIFAMNIRYQKIHRDRTF